MPNFNCVRITTNTKGLRPVSVCSGRNTNFNFFSLFILMIKIFSKFWIACRILTNLTDSKSVLKKVDSALIFEDIFASRDDWAIFSNITVRNHGRDALHCSNSVQKFSCPLKIYFVNLNKSPVSFGYVQTYTAWKLSKYGVFSGPYFTVFSPNTGKYGPEKTPYLDTFSCSATKDTSKRKLNFSPYTDYENLLSLVHISMTLQNHIQNPVRHLRWSFFVKIVNSWKPLTIFVKNFY